MWLLCIQHPFINSSDISIILSYKISKYHSQSISCDLEKTCSIYFYTQHVTDTELLYYSGRTRSTRCSRWTRLPRHSWYPGCKGKYFFLLYINCIFYWKCFSYKWLLLKKILSLNTSLLLENSWYILEGPFFRKTIIFHRKERMAKMKKLLT